MDLRKVDDLYRDKVILDHCRNPRNSIYLNDSDLVCDAINSFCGDEIHIQINIDQSQKIADIGYQSEGCAINQATGSLITEYIRGLSLSDAKSFISSFTNVMEDKTESYPKDEATFELGDLEVLYRVKEFPIRIKCVLLSISALKSGLYSYE